ncbi:MAG: hypothetical protein AAGJ80_20820, partial [Cyanobacteria bacterium J06553_1]
MNDFCLLIMTFPFFSGNMDKRKSTRKSKLTEKPWEKKDMMYYLFYISKERKYVYFTPISHWWPKHLDGNLLVRHQAVHFSSDGIEFVAKFIMAFSSEKEVMSMATKLTKKIDSEKLNTSSSFAFLDSSSASQELSGASAQQTVPDLDTHGHTIESFSDDDASSSCSSASDQSLLEGNFTKKRNTPKAPDRFQSSRPLGQKSTDSAEICRLLRVNNKLLTDQTKEIRRLRRAVLLNPFSRTNPVADTDSADPVMYAGKDVTKIGRSNLDHTQYAVYLVRSLFRDEELVGKSIFPKKITSRPPLSPRRSSVVSDAIRSRFRLDLESPELQECY